MSSNSTHSEPDAWFFKPSFVCLTAVTILQLACQIPGGLSLAFIPLAALSYLLLALAVLCGAVYHFAKTKVRKGTSILLVILLPLMLWLPINWVADVIHISLTRGLGVGQLGKAERSSDGKFAAYNWSVGLVTNPETYLIHDPTDEIALPVAQHKKPLNSELGFAELCAGKARHVVGHDYVCTF